jgi:hypothetical protein
VFWDLFDLKALILAAVILLLTHIKKFAKLHPILYLAASAAVGIVFSFAGA